MLQKSKKEVQDRFGIGKTPETAKKQCDHAKFDGQSDEFGKLFSLYPPHLA